MQDRRVEPRLLCAELLDIRWKDKTGRGRRVVGNLEDISITGACLQLESPIPLHMKVTLMHPTGDLTGVVRYCVFRDIGYFVGVQFDPDVKWNPKNFRPQHLLDPRRLVSRAVHRVMQRDGIKGGDGIQVKDESRLTH
jgi:hypothetical protein